MKTAIRFICALCIVAILAVGAKLIHDKYPSLLSDLISGNSQTSTHDISASQKDLYGPYDFIRVVDGDTIIANIDGAETRIRLIGIDTPESVNPDPDKNVPEGKIASDFTKGLFSDITSVYLEYDVQERDNYDRLLAYVYLDGNGDVMAQDEILRAGMATTMTIQPNSIYADHFYAIMKEAQNAGVGLWATEFFSQK